MREARPSLQRDKRTNTELYYSWLFSSPSVPKMILSKYMHIPLTEHKKVLTAILFQTAHLCYGAILVLLPHLLTLMIILLFQQERKNADGGHVENRWWAVERSNWPLCTAQKSNMIPVLDNDPLWLGTKPSKWYMTFSPDRLIKSGNSHSRSVYFFHSRQCSVCFSG